MPTGHDFCLRRATGWPANLPFMFLPLIVGQDEDRSRLAQDVVITTGHNRWPVDTAHHASTVVCGDPALIRVGAALRTAPPWNNTESSYLQRQADGTWHRITGAQQASSARPHPLAEQQGDLK